MNEDVGGDNSYPYNALQWYHVEFRDIDWVDKDFDYYVDGELIKADIPLRNPGNVNDVELLYLYNFHTGSERPQLYGHNRRDEKYVRSRAGEIL